MMYMIWILNQCNRFSNIWFFDATSDATLFANFKELGKAIGCGEDVKNVRNFLGRSHHNWLCIFDNADDRKVDLENYIPRCNHGNIIVTSRLAELSQINSPGCYIEFGDLDEKSAIKLLLKHAQSESSEMNVNLSLKIVIALGSHALAVSTAGAYIHANATCTLANYLTRFNKKRREMLTYKKESIRPVPEKHIQCLSIELRAAQLPYTISDADLFSFPSHCNSHGDIHKSIGLHME